MTGARGVGGHNGTPTSQRTSTASVLKDVVTRGRLENGEGKSPNGWNLGKIVGILNPNKTNMQRSNMIHQLLTGFLIDLINPVLWLAGNMIVKDPDVHQWMPKASDKGLS